MNNGRNFGVSRHASTLGAPDLVVTRCTGNCNQGRMCDCVPNIEETMRTIHATITQPGDGRHPARTYSSEAEAFRTARYAAALEKPRPSARLRDALFGLALAAVVCATLWVLFTYRAAP